jgi:carbamoyl-phosphate synthase large subunit
MIGASLDVINKAEDRGKFRYAIEKIGLRMPKSGFARSMSEVMKIADERGTPGNRQERYRRQYDPGGND